MKRIFFSLILLLYIPLTTYSQFVVLLDTSIYSSKDTTVAPFVFDTTSYPGSNFEEFVPEIEKSLRSYWQKEFMKLISVSGSKESKPQSDNGTNYQKYSGKIIRNIDLIQLEVFGQTVLDTSQRPNTRIKKLGNDLHVNTRRNIILKKIFIQPGDSIDPFSLADNERLIRQLPYIKNVRILVTEVENDSVDLLFLTKDVYSMGFGLEIFDISYGQTGIWDKNIFGIGHEFYYYLSWNYNKPHNYGHKVKYRIQNIGNTFLTANFSYENLWETKAFRIFLNRNFLTPEMKYAGGIGFESIRSTINIELQDTILLDEKVDYDYLDLWIGRSFLLSQSYRKNKRTSFAVTGRLMKYNFFKRPENVSAHYMHDYHKRTMMLGLIGLSSQTYKKSYLVYGFGKSEDIPSGLLLTFSAGFEKDEFYERPYIGFSYSFGAFGPKFGMIFFRIEYGTFFNNGMEQGTINLLFQNYSPLLNQEGRYNYRLFTKINYKTGINRFNDEFLKLDNNNNIRGLKNASLKGDQLFNINFETVCYSPHNILGFRFVYFLFIDAGIINTKNKILAESPVYSGIGAGIRIKNENLVFNTIQLRFSFYPIAPANSELQYVYLSGMTAPQHESFIIPKPQVIE